MMKRVRYNGGTQSYYGCTGDPRQLVVGQTYEVVSTNVMAWQTDYTLKGVDGEFNSVWFDEINVYLAFSNRIPEVGKTYECNRLIACGNRAPLLESVTTSTINTVNSWNSNTYEVHTCNSIYVVQVAF